MEIVSLQVGGMSCGHCVKAIEGSVGDLAGVTKVKVQLETGIVDVEYKLTEVSLDKIKEIINDQGYDVQ